MCCRDCSDLKIWQWRDLNSVVKNQSTMSKSELLYYNCNCRGSSPHNWIRTGERHLRCVSCGRTVSESIQVKRWNDFVITATEKFCMRKQSMNWELKIEMRVFSKERLSVEIVSTGIIDQWYQFQNSCLRRVTLSDFILRRKSQSEVQQKGRSLSTVLLN